MCIRDRFTGDWQTYTDVYLDVPLDAGFQTIRFNATHEGWNINYFDIQMGAKAVVTPEGVTKIEAEDFDGQGGDPAMGDKAGIGTEPCGEDSTENIGSTDAGDYFYYDCLLYTSRHVGDGPGAGAAALYQGGGQHGRGTDL